MESEVNKVKVKLSRNPFQKTHQQVIRLRAIALNDKAFKTTHKCCGTTARQEKKLFMKHYIGLPSNQLMSALLSQLLQFKRFPPYLLGWK
jgi:hypothetical protein